MKGRFVFRRSRSGFTLIEIMVVVIVLGILAAVVIPKLSGNTDQARVSKTRSDIQTLATMVESFRLNMGRYPTQDEGLSVLRERPNSDDAESWKGPYLSTDVPKDGWKKPYIYSVPSPNGIDEYGIESYGADNSPGGEGYNADIVSWNNSEETK